MVRSPAPASGKLPVPALTSLHEVFSRIPDPRRNNRRHSLAALLSGLLLGFCAGHNTMRQVVIFLREEKSLRKSIGFTHPTAPSQSTYNRLFNQLDAKLLIDAMGEWLNALALERIGKGRRKSAVAVDGKTARGTGEHAVYLFIQDYWLLLDLFEVGEKANEYSQFYQKLDEILEKYPFLSIFTMDALFAQHALAEKLTQQGRRAIFQIKDNQKETHRKMRQFFGTIAHRSPDVETTEKKWGLHHNKKGVGRKRPR